MTQARTCMIAFITLATVQLYPIEDHSMSTITFKEDSEYTLNETRFKASQGWKFNPTNSRYSAPEGDLSIYFIEIPATLPVEEMSLNAWRSIYPDFGLHLFQKLTPPAEGDWDQTHILVYETPSSESRSVFAKINVLDNIAYINLIEGSLDGISRRGAQLQIAIESWRPTSFRKEDFSQVKAKSLTADDIKKFEAFVSQAMDKLLVPGVAIGIVRDNKVSYRGCFGVKKKRTTERVTSDTLFMIGSVTKPLTTLMISKLIELEKFSWETPVIKLLPSFTLADAETTKRITMRDTVSASTGMPRRDMEFIFAPIGLTAEDTIRQMASMKPTTGFGETFQYSNHLVALGGFAAAHVYKDKGNLMDLYNAAMQELVFTPLGMKKTIVRPSQNTLGRASPHATDYKGNLLPIPSDFDDTIYSVAPAGSLWSTVDDLLAFILMELNKGTNTQGIRLFSEEQILKRRMPGAKIDHVSSYGLGWFISDEQGIEVIGHGGNTFGFTSDLFFIPEHNIGVVILTNAASENAFMHTIKQKLFELFFGIGEGKADSLVDYYYQSRQNIHLKIAQHISVNPKDTKWIADYIGTYHNPDLGTIQIKKTPHGLECVTQAWKSAIGSFQEIEGKKLIALISPPLAASFNLQVQLKPEKKLILDAAQVKYEFKAR